MALLHRASITPTKQEVLESFVPGQPWCPGGGSGESGDEVRQVGSFRFDDPADEVGLETFLVQVGDGPVLHVPITFRGAPLEGGEAHLITTMEHSVLGRRWVYDGVGDPVYVAALATVVLTGGEQAPQDVLVDGRREARALSTFVRGSGTPGEDVPDDADVHVVRVVDATEEPPRGAAILAGTWPGSATPAVLAWVTGEALQA